MASKHSEPESEMPVLTALKILISGGFGVGKTTLVGSVSEVRPLRTEESLTAAGAGVDSTTGVERKSTTTVALDYGRITIRDDLVVYLFGTPGQDRFWFMWDELAVGALGAVVLVDTRRLELSFAAIDYFEKRGLPFIVAVNEFPDAEQHTTGEVAQALDLDPEVPIMAFDALRKESGKQVLITLLRHLLDRTPAESSPDQPVTPPFGSDTG